MIAAELRREKENTTGSIFRSGGLPYCTLAKITHVEKTISMNRVCINFLVCKIVVDVMQKLACQSVDRHKLKFFVSADSFGAVMFVLGQKCNVLIGQALFNQ